MSDFDDWEQTIRSMEGAEPFNHLNLEELYRKSEAIEKNLETYFGGRRDLTVSYLKGLEVADIDVRVKFNTNTRDIMAEADRIRRVYKYIVDECFALIFNRDVFGDE